MKRQYRIRPNRRTGALWNSGDAFIWSPLKFCTFSKLSRPNRSNIKKVMTIFVKNIQRVELDATASTGMPPLGCDWSLKLGFQVLIWPLVTLTFDTYILELLSVLGNVILDAPTKFQWHMSINSGDMGLNSDFWPYLVIVRPWTLTPNTQKFISSW